MRFNKTYQTNNRRLNRSCVRSTMVGGRGRQTNHLGNALAAFRRAIRAHRRLMKLAPDLYDYGIVRHNKIEREKEDRRLAELEAIIRKVYGVTELSPEAERALRPKIFVKKLNPRTERVIAHELEQWSLWLEIGNESLALFERHHQLFRVSLSQIASLLDVAMTLGRLSTGRETDYEPAPPNLEVNYSFEAALQKIYGSQGGTGDPPVPAGDPPGGSVNGLKVGELKVEYLRSSSVLTSDL